MKPKIVKKTSAQITTSSEFPPHPCMNPDACSKFARIHLPVAKKCNITCVFCARHNSGAGPNLPGVSAGIMTPREALEHLRAQRKIWGGKAVVGVSGPGEPLYNPETFETFRLIKNSFPEHPLCLCTNGLLLAEKAGELRELSISSISVSITGITPNIVGKMHPRISAGRASLIDETPVRLIDSQIKGIKAAREQGIFVKVNMIVAKGINDAHPPTLAKTLAKLGVGIMNITPVIPPGSQSNLRPPDNILLESLRDECAGYIPQFRDCKQCRSDAAGIPDVDLKFIGAPACESQKTAAIL